MGQLCINAVYTYTHRKMRMPDNMYEHWDRWQQEQEEREAEDDAREECARKYREETGQEEDLEAENIRRKWVYPRSDYEKFIMGGTLLFMCIFATLLGTSMHACTRLAMAGSPSVRIKLSFYFLAQNQ